VCSGRTPLLKQLSIAFVVPGCGEEESGSSTSASERFGGIGRSDLDSIVVIVNAWYLKTTSKRIVRHTLAHIETAAPQTPDKLIRTASPSNAFNRCLAPHLASLALVRNLATLITLIFDVVSCPVWKSRETSFGETIVHPKYSHKPTGWVYVLFSYSI
jgi:hypothetical protein